jgi:hypothetical protein
LKYGALGAWFALSALASSCGGKGFTGGTTDAGTGGQSAGNGGQSAGASGQSAGNGGQSAGASGQSAGSGGQSAGASGQSAGSAGQSGSTGNGGQSGSSAGQGGSAGQVAGNGGQSGNAGQSGIGGQSGGGQAGSGGKGGSAGLGGVTQGGSGGISTNACKFVAGANSCPADEYCQAPTCGDGMCVPRGKTVTTDLTPVCGCDGLTYWNASLAAQAGMSVASAGACEKGLTCGGFAAMYCPATSFCNYQIPDKNSCGGADLSGTCWVLPTVCPVAVGFGPQTRACNAATCVDQCTLIRQQTLWYADGSCPK